MSAIIMRHTVFALAMAAFPSIVSAQSSPNWSYGYTPTAGEYRAAFSAKQDLLNFTPLNLAGGTMRGKLNTLAATSNQAGFSILPGVAPSSATNGDLWLTSSGLFAQINGQTVQFLSSASLGTMASQNSNSVAITGGTINGTGIGGTTPAAGAFTTLSAATPVALTSGGTGAATASVARSNLGAAASGANTDITSLASPALGSPTMTTQTAGDSSTKGATTAFVGAAVSAGASTTPPGAVMHFATSSCPATWLKANSAAVSRTTYSNLFAAIGTTYGSGDGSTTFNLPELRGEFIRGLDDGRGIDASRALGSAQAQNLPNFQLRMPMGFDGSNFYGWYTSGSVPAFGSETQSNVSRIVAAGTAGSGAIRTAYTDTTPLNVTGELRSRNVALLACIKS